MRSWPPAGIGSNIVIITSRLPEVINGQRCTSGFPLTLNIIPRQEHHRWVDADAGFSSGLRLVEGDKSAQPIVCNRIMAFDPACPAMLHGENERVTEGCSAGGTSADVTVLCSSPQARAMEKAVSAASPTTNNNEGALR